MIFLYIFLRHVYAMFTVALASETRDAFGFEFSPKSSPRLEIQKITKKWSELEALV